MEDIKIYVLNDNNCYDEKFECEHGLSFYVETKDSKFLFDSGETSVFLNNAEKMNIDLNEIDFIAISHGDYDHANGLKYLNVDKKDLYMHPDCFLYRKSKRTLKFDGLNQTKEELQEKFNLKECKMATKIKDKIYFLGQIERQEKFFIGGLPMTNEQGEDYLHYDDSGVAIDTEKGLVVITGCSHSGLCNIVETAKKVTGKSEVYAVVGGFHLKEIDEKTNEVINYLKENSVQKILIAHCVSTVVCERFFEEFKDKATRVETGKVYNI